MWAKTSDIFLQKHFNKTMKLLSLEKIMNDFPEPACQALQVPKLDKDMIKKAGKDLHFGAEFTLQSQLLDMAGPVTCLWSDLKASTAEVKPRKVILLIKRVFAVLSNASDSTTLP